MSKIKAKRVLKMMENDGKSMSKAMRSVGYSPNYAKNPQNFNKTRTWQEIMEAELPEELVAKVHRELFGAAEIQHYEFPIEGKGKNKKRLTNAEIKAIIESVPDCRLIYIKDMGYQLIAYFQSPDSRSRKEAVEMAYKLRGNYAPEKISITKRKYQDLSNAELAAAIKLAKDKLLKR